MRVAALVPVVLAALLSGCSGSGGDFVTRSGRQLVLDGRPFRFVGFNMYDAAATQSYSCDPQHAMTDHQLLEAMEQVHRQAGATVIRFWAYQTYTQGGTDWSGVDRVIDAAREAGMRVMPVLEDGPGDCTTGTKGVAKDEVEGDDWYTRGYREPYGDARLSYRKYVRLITKHYADDPTILGWTMVNEAETSARDAQGRSALVDFARDIAGVIHASDAHHLVTLGTQGNGAPGASGPDFRAVYSVPGLDFTEVHDYPRNGSSEADPLPGTDARGALPSTTSSECASTSAPLACSFAFARALDKPLVVGEVGVQASRSATSVRRRARILHQKAVADFAAGASGFLVWQYNTAQTDGYDVLPGAGDPVFAALRSALPKASSG